MNNHLNVYYNINKVCVDFFKKKGGGVIINFSSIYGSYLPRFEIYKGTQMSMPLEYAIAKNSIMLMSKFLAKENLKNKIRINCVSPGGIFDNQNSKFVLKYNKYCAHKEMLKPSDLFSVVEFLLKDSSKKITGQNLIIDDGFTL